MKILIVSALPYDVSSSTRAFRTYFNNFKKEDLAQIYTNTSFPSFSFCNNFYQITDKMILNIFFKKNDAGIVLKNNEFKNTQSIKKNNNHTFLKKDIAFLHFLRLWLWKEKRWYTEKLKKWISDFKPDCIFYHNSNSLFISKIAFKISIDFNIPLIMEISDDYYFVKKNNFSIITNFYNRKYKDFFIKMLNHSSGCIFVSEKMMEKYKCFNIKNADYIHICSELNNTNINKVYKKNTFCFFGNTGFNRSKSLILLGKKLASFNDNFYIDIFSPLRGNSGFKKNVHYKGLRFCGFLEYSKLVQKISNYEYIIVAEPLDNKTSKYISLSLSTKVSDSLFLKRKIICVGNSFSGTVDFIEKNKCGMVLKTKKEIMKMTADFFYNFNWENFLSNCDKVSRFDFSLENNKKKALTIFKESIKEGIKNENS